MNLLLNDRCLSAAALVPGEHVVDFGAGLGQFSRAMARATGVKVIGIEWSEQQIREAAAQAEAQGETDLLDMRQGDVAHPPLRESEWGHFDVAHARFLLEHVPDPLAVVRSMLRAVRPGGRLLLADDDYDLLRLWPEPPGFAPVWSSYQRTYDRHRNDPIVGRRLVQLLHEAGAQPKRNNFVFFGSCSGQPDFEHFVGNLITILAEARDEIAETGLPPEVVRSTLDALSTWCTRPDAALWHAVSWAEGTKPN